MTTFKKITLVVIFLSSLQFMAQNRELKKELDASLVIINGKIIDGTGSVPITDGIVAIKGDRITAVGKRKDYQIPKGVKIIDAKGGTIMPGLIDSHVHEGYDGSFRKSYLALGVTSICDLGSGLSKLKQFESEFSGGSIIARGFRAGPIITAVNGLPGIAFDSSWRYDACRETDSVEKAITITRDLLDSGIDIVKIYLENHVIGYPIQKMLNLQQVKAIAQETHKKGKLLRAHLTDMDNLELAYKGDVDVFEHVPLPKIEKAMKDSIIAAGNPLKILEEKYKSFYDDWFPKMIEKGIIMVPTFDRGPVGSYYYKENRTEWENAVVAFILNIVRKYHNLGGIIAFGTDYNATGERKLDASVLQNEFELLSKAGLTPLEIINAATLKAAEVSGHGKDLGSIEKGKLADILIIKGRPDLNIKDIANLAAVIKDGKIVNYNDN